MNTLKVVLLLAALSGILLLVGSLVAGRIGLIAALILSTVMNIGGYWYSDRIVLRMYDAKAVTRVESPVLYDVVQGLVAQERMPMPKVYIIADKSPNAFATGRDEKHAVVAVTSGILDLLNRDELTGVIGHELSHIRHRDILIGTMAATIASTVVVLANVAKWTAMMGGAGADGEGTVALIATAVVAPVAATLVQMAISRSRE
jgi:heat shock protein HtpX